MLDLLYRVQKRVVSLVGSVLSSDLQALSHRSDVASLSLFYKYYYGKCSSELVDLVLPKRVIVRSTRFSEQMHRHTINSPMCRTKFYQSSFFLRTSAPSPMNAFHQITISQHSKGFCSTKAKPSTHAQTCIRPDTPNSRLKQFIKIK